MNSLQRSFLIGFCFLSLLLPISTIATEIPDKIEYCGMELEIGPGAKKALSDQIKSIQSSKVYFDRMVLRAQKYFPYIEAAFTKHNVPHDLKYLAIQESSLRPNAVSSSKAVGFWQFKAPTAIEVGLEVNEKVDERRHIFRSSEGAAIYLSKANFDFTNWVYAVISYYEGPTGAVKHTNPDYFAVKSMKIDKDLHWYAIKAIAHKLAYAEAVDKAQQENKPLKEGLEMLELIDGRKLGHIMKDNKLTKEDFLIYNPWMLKFGSFPPKKSYFVFLPTYNLPAQNVAKLVENQGKQTANKDVPAEKESDSRSKVEPVLTSLYPQAISRTILLPSQYASFPLDKDLHYGVEFIRHESEMPLSMMAMKLKISLADLLVWNGLIPGKEPAKGQVLYLKKPKKSEFHVVQEGEDLGEIASRHKSSVNKIRKKNRMGKENLQIYIGQKLYLKKKKPKGERMIILVNDKIEEDKVIEIKKDTPTKTDPATSKGSEGKDEVEATWVEHKVAEGETLWGISQKYNTKVEIIKMINKLPNDNIQPGQVLRILAKKK
ncbi:MAG: LysM peptidoglycan-binding domain-containing protein [Bacteroidia bacterium]|nr:LysM peptidoglycan-binding domain-containing protein [Bacteroidia bacterium]